jgi:DivIVA domain-containing protein
VGVLVLEIVVAAVVVFVVAAVAMGYGGSITHFAPDWPGRRLPENRTLRPDDVNRLRFSLAFRGYRMAEVDDALDRLATEIAERDARIEQLTGQPYETPPEDPTAPSDAVAAADVTAPIRSDDTAPIADASHPLDLASSESNDPADPNAAL